MPHAPLLKVIQYLRSNLLRLLVIFALLLGVIGLSKSIFDKITNLNSQYSSEKRRPNSSSNDIVKIKSKLVEDIRPRNKVSSSTVEPKEVVSIKNNSPDDLAVFSQFESWLQKWETLHCDPSQECIHDPRKIKHLLNTGEKLAFQRAELLAEMDKLERVSKELKKDK